MSVCRWVRDKEVPGGKFLVPGCLNRAIYGDYADCHCKTSAASSLIDRIEALEQEIADLKRGMKLDAPHLKQQRRSR